MSIFSALKTRKSFHHLNLSNEKYYYVNKSGNDSNDGLTPETAKLTINAGLNLLNLGDHILIGVGFYTENIDVNVDFVKVTSEWGAIILGTVTISGFAVNFESIQAFPSSGNAYNISGNSCRIIDCAAVAGIIGFYVTGGPNLFIRCNAIGYTQSAWDLSNSIILIREGVASGAGGNTRGFYFSNSAAHSCLLENCLSNRNILAGYELVSSCEFNIIKNCISGSDDGKKIDENDTNIWVNFQDELPQQHNEFLYPGISGEGVSMPPVTVNNDATNDVGGTRTDRWYYGDIIRIIPKNAITEEFKFYGVNIAVGTANKDVMFQLLFTNGIEASQNGGNDWDQNETILTVDDASDFIVDDWIWIIGDDVPDGEIVKISNIASNVITIVRDITASAGTGLRYDYDITPVNNKIYLVHRPSNTVYHKIDDNFSAPSAKDFIAYRLSQTRIISANGACLVRCSNGTDNLSVDFEIRAKCEI